MTWKAAGRGGAYVLPCGFRFLPVCRDGKNGAGAAPVKEEGAALSPVHAGDLPRLRLFRGESA